MASTWSPWLAAERPVSLEQDILFQSRPELYERLTFLAEHMAIAALSPQPSAAAVFGISAPWGAGKSSALHVLLDLVLSRLQRDHPVALDKMGFSLNGQYVVTTSTFRAHLQATSSQPARLSLAYEILRAFPGPYRSQLLEDLNYSDANDLGSIRPINAELFLREKLASFSHIGPSVEEWILNSFLEYRDELPTTGSEGERLSHIHIQFIDDLDRCTESYTADVLAALSFWTALPNLFFVLAADEQHLQRSAQAATDLHERYPGEALEKYVHFQLRLPGLVKGYVDAAEYCLHLMPDAGLSPGVAHLRNLLARAGAGGPLGVLAPALAVGTPRQAKRTLNELLQEFHILKDLEGDSVKRIIARFVWPDAYSQHVSPALTASSSPGRRSISAATNWLSLVLQAAAQALDEHPDNHERATDRLRDTAYSWGLNLRDCPPELLMYLAAFPPLALPSSSNAVTTENPETPNKSMAESVLLDTTAAMDAGNPLEALELEARIASGLDKHEEVVAVGRKAVALVRDAEPRPEDAPALGNIAFRLDNRDAELAWQLHSIAHSWDPTHENIRLNLVEFLMDHGGPGAMPVVLEHLDWLAQTSPQYKPERQRLLNARLALATGGSPSDLDILLHDATADDAGFTFRWHVADVLAEANDVTKLERLIELWAHHEAQIGEVKNVGLVLRILGNKLATMGAGEWASRAADVFRHVLRRGYTEGNTTFAATANNAAVILKGRDYLEQAGMLWRLAYSVNQVDSRLKAVYAKYLLDRGDARNAQAVQQGQELSLPVPSDADLASAFASLPLHFSIAPWWWEQYVPTVPFRPLYGIDSGGGE